MSYNITIEPAEMRVAPFEGNFTYNVSTMLRRAGVHPVVMNGMSALNARVVLRHAVALMEDNMVYFRQFDAPNGWGTVGTTLIHLREMSNYLEKCPDEYIVRWR